MIMTAIVGYKYVTGLYVQSLVAASGEKFSTSHRIEDVDEAIAKLQTPLTRVAKFILKRVVPWARQSVGTLA